MPTDEERREVARRLRHARTAHEIGEAVGVNCHGGLCNGCASEAAQLLADLIEPDESGQNQDTNPDTVQKESPAVQIAPECDRDALLALADEMTVEKGDIWGWSSRIREALGVGK